MLKRLALSVLVVIVSVGAVELVSAQKKTSTQEKTRESNPLPTTINETNNCVPTQQKEGSANGVQGWHKFVTWPESWTAWAIIVTLGVISWQACLMRIHAKHFAILADATFKQTEISRKALISQFRPKVPVRSMWLTQNNGALMVEIWVTNTGDTPAHIAHSAIKIAWEVPAELKKMIVTSAAFQPVSLQPGQDHSVIIDITEIASPHGVSLIAVNEMGREQEAWIYCFGNLTYLDDNETKRSTGFFRKYDIKRKRFIPSDDPEEEYTG